LISESDVKEKYRPEQAVELLSNQGTEDLFSPLTASPYIVLELREEFSTDIIEQLIPLLAQLPCPVIALAAERVSTALAAVVDCVLLDEKWLTAIVGNISKAPIAAMSLVQLSKAIDKLDLMAALDMESLTYGCLQGGAEYQTWLQSYTAEPMPALSDQAPVLLERLGEVLSLTLNRPERRNSITVEMRDALVEALALAAVDASIEKIVLQGAGKCFSVGGELREFGSVPDSASGHMIRSLRLPGRLLARVANRCEARVHGACIGAGVELPAFAGRVVATPSAYFQLPEIQFGLIPGAGGCVSIAKRTGRHRFNQMALSGKRVNAKQALDWGLVDAVSEFF
jgi:enoyl-CoA hydratase